MDNREIRADYDDRSVVVYQAYSPHIAEQALAAGTFVAPFKMERMTWIKPSFLWMMYRCGWGLKEGQEVVLAIRVLRSGFDWAVAHAVSSSEQVKGKPDVRVQWDPERDLHLRPLAHRSIQIGLAGEAVRRYVREWIVDISDVTDLAHEIHDHVRRRDLDGATALLPAERPYGTFTEPGAY